MYTNCKQFMDYNKQQSCVTNSEEIKYSLYHIVLSSASSQFLPI